MAASSNPVQGAEPVTAIPEGQGDSVGRTAGANPATGATEARLARFAQEVMERCWSSYSIDWSDIQEFAEKHGIVQWEPYSKEKHGSNPWDADEGDPIYFLTPDVVALASRSEQQKP